MTNINKLLPCATFVQAQCVICDACIYFQIVSAGWVSAGKAWSDEGLCRHLDHTALDAEGPIASFSCRSVNSQQAKRYTSKGAYTSVTPVVLLIKPYGFILA